MHEEERRRDLSDIPTAKLIGLEIQTNEQLKKEIRSLPIKISHRVLNDARTAPENGDSETTIKSVWRNEGQLNSGPFEAFMRGDMRDVVRAALAELTDLKETLSEIASEATSDGVRVAAIKAIENVSGRMFEIIRSTAVIPTISDDNQIDAILEGWAARDRRELMYECVSADQGTHSVGIQALNALHDGDAETAENLWAAFEERVHTWAKKRMHEEISELRDRLAANTIPNNKADS